MVRRPFFFCGWLSVRPLPNPLLLPSRYAKEDNNPCRTEDDILHLRKPPLFGGNLDACDSELLLSYLTEPYLRVPLVLGFFCTADRIHSLRHPELQALLMAALFECGRHMPRGPSAPPSEVPTTNRTALATPYGLLLNELCHAPAVVLTLISKLLELAIALDTGDPRQSTTVIILYVVRLASRFESYASFVVEHTKGAHEAVATPLRDSPVTPAALALLEAGLAKLREALRGDA